MQLVDFGTVVVTNQFNGDSTFELSLEPGVYKPNVVVVRGISYYDDGTLSNVFGIRTNLINGILGPFQESSFYNTINASHKLTQFVNNSNYLFELIDCGTLERVNGDGTLAIVLEFQRWVSE